MSFDGDSEYYVFPNGRKECHPLMNPLIVQKIVQGLHNVENLKNCRLVCKLWNKVTTPYLQDRSQIRLPECTTDHEFPLFRKFMTNFEDVGRRNIFYRNYLVERLHMDDLDGKNMHECKEFWQKFGYSMKSLVLQDIKFHSHNVVQDVIKWTSCNLERLTFRDCTSVLDEVKQFENVKLGTLVNPGTPQNRNLKVLNMYLSENQKKVPFHWNNLLFLCPNINELVLYNASNDQVMDLLNCIQYSRKHLHSNRFRLQKLNIFNGEYAQPDLNLKARDLLLSLNFPLKELSIDIGAFSTETDVKPIFQKYHLTLEKITIYRGPLGKGLENFSFGITFPKVKELEITETTTTSMNFLSHFPMLEKLSICEPPEVEPTFVRTSLIENTDESTVYIPKNLSYLRIDYQMNDSDVEKLVKMFHPCNGTRALLKEVHLYLTNKSFRLICENWKTLQVLEIYGKEVTDDGILGFSGIDAKDAISRDKDQLEMDLEEIRRPRLPNITDLHCLTKFIMKNDHCQSDLTDMVVIHGFRYMKSLRHVEMCSLMTRLGWKMLYDMPQIETLIPLMCGYEKYNCKKLEIREGVKMHLIL